MVFKPLYVIKEAEFNIKLVIISL